MKPPRLQAGAFDSCYAGSCAEWVTLNRTVRSAVRLVVAQHTRQIEMPRIRPRHQVERRAVRIGHNRRVCDENAFVDRDLEGDGDGLVGGTFPVQPIPLASVTTPEEAAALSETWVVAVGTTS